MNSLAPLQQIIAGFEESYVSVRSKEQRIYTDAEAAVLPDIAAGHIHYREWLSRKRSAQRLIDYLRSKKKPLKILEVGCGNGWLSAFIGTIPGTTVTGIDCNKTEVEQASRLFSRVNVSFFDVSFQDLPVPDQKYDQIIFAASVQYFPSFQKVIRKAIGLLKAGGEIHIIDSHFYKEGELGSAIRRTEEYYARIGHPGMARHYFHHALNDLDAFHYRVQHNPNSLSSRIFRRNQKFYWISISNQK